MGRVRRRDDRSQEQQECTDPEDQVRLEQWRVIINQEANGQCHCEQFGEGPVKEAGGKIRNQNEKILGNVTSEWADWLTSRERSGANRWKIRRHWVGLQENMETL
jgi:hypothetical protein